MPEPATLAIGLKEAIIAFLALFGINLLGWKMFATSKLKQIERHEERIIDLETDHISRKYLNDLGREVNKKIDNLTERIDDLYKELIK